MNIYLIASPSKNLIKEEIANIIKNEQNIVTFDYLREGLDFILEEASYLSLFNDKKYLIVKNSNIFSSGKTKDEDLKKLEAYLNNPNSNTVVIFTLTEKVDERKKITKIIKEKYNYKNIASLNSKELIDKIINILKGHKIKIDYNNASYIANNSLNNYDLVAQELDKLILFYDEGDIVKESDINNLISKTPEENIFKFSDAVIKKDNKMFEIFNDLRLLKEEPVVLINALAREYRLTYKCSYLNQNGYNKSKIASELGLQDWMVDKYLRLSYNYREEDLLQSLSKLSDIDVEIKQGKIDKYLAIEMFMLDI